MGTRRNLLLVRRRRPATFAAVLHLRLHLVELRLLVSSQRGADGFLRILADRHGLLAFRVAFDRGVIAQGIHLGLFRFHDGLHFGLLVSREREFGGQALEALFRIRSATAFATRSAHPIASFALSLGR